MLKAVRTPRTRGRAVSRGLLFAGDILSKKYHLRPSHRAAARCRRVLTSYTQRGHPHGDSLKDISAIDYLNAGASGVTTRAGWQEREKERREENREIPQPVIRGMHNQDSAGPKRAHTCSSAACFVSCPDDFKLRRYRRTISATAAEVPAGPG